MTKEEMETIIRWDAKEKVAHINTFDPVQIRKLDKLVEEHGDTYKLVKTDDYGGKWYDVTDKKYIRFGKPASEARIKASMANFAKRNAQNEF